MKFTRIALLLAIFLLASFTRKEKYKDLKDGIYAEIVTSKGTMVAQLYYDKAPMTVANFVALAEGKHPLLGKEYRKKPFYNGLTFHRVIENFMIQGGDKTGTGAGDVGYKFPQEVRKDLKHDEPGVLSMANAGPGTNGSQFFIMHKATPSLDMKYNVFGKVIKNVEVVEAIATVPKNKNDKPLENVYMQEINIIRVGKQAKKWKADKVFTQLVKESEEKDNAEKKKMAAYKENAPAAREAKKNEFTKLKAMTLPLPSGVQLYIRSSGKGGAIADNAEIEVDYNGFFVDGRLFDSSSKEVSLIYDNYNPRRDEAAAYKPLTLMYSKDMKLIPGFRDALLTMSYGDEVVAFIPSDQGYGERGSGSNIPRNTDLIFEIKILEKK